MNLIYSKGIFMRTDIFDFIRTIIMNGIKPNYSKIARQFNCDSRTVKRYFLNKISNSNKPKRKTRVYKSILEPYTDIIKDKLAQSISFKGIYTFIKTKGFNGSYSTVRRYCCKFEQNKKKEAIIRFETQPGLQAQVDWKESLKLKNKSGEEFEVNIFLVLLGYSRYKYLMLTTDRSQPTVFKGLLNSFKYFGGVPKEILFDNMRSIVDQSRTQYGKPIYNTKFYSFTKDAGFIAKSCLAYRPQTKGKVESLARLVNRIKVYNSEFENLEELENIIIKFNEEINNEICQGTGVRPIDRLREEQKYLNPLPKLDIFEEYLNLNANKRKVTSESMISINGKKYSVPPQYINMEVFYQLKNEIIEIYNSNQTLICSHSVSNRKLNYRKEDFEQIAEKALTESNVISKVCASNLAMYDSI